MRPLHGKKDERSFVKANFDNDEQFVGASEQGLFMESQNMHHPIDGDGSDMKKISGEELKYDSLDNACYLTTPYSQLAATYRCIGEAKFFLDGADHIIEFWADAEGTLPAFARIDGIVVIRSDDFPLTVSHPLQIDVNDNCDGGEIYITDDNVPPMIFNLRDVMKNGRLTSDNICTRKYFDNFDITLYQLELTSSNNHPMFVQLTATTPLGAIKIGGSGHKVGQVQYQFRYATLEGDRTGWSAPTPLIPIPIKLSQDSSTYPNNKTFGAEPQTVSQLGVHLKFRIDNSGGFEFIEIKRTRYTIGGALEVPAIEKLLDFKIPVTPNQLEVISIFDVADESYELDLTDEDSDTNFAVIDRAKAVRYYNQRLHFMNVRYKSRTVGATFKESAGGQKAFPIVQPIGTDGHKNPYHHTYHRSLMNGEKYGWGVLFRDGNSQRSFVEKIGTDSFGNDFDNYQVPNRRELATIDTVNFSSPIKAMTTLGVIGKCYEVFDTDNCVGKSFANNYNVYNPTISAALIPPMGGYNVWKPTGQHDLNITDHLMRPNTLVTVNGISGTFANYNPSGFGVSYNSIGLGVTGIQNIPSHIKSFSVVRTKPAQRVFAQGIGFYSLGNPSFFELTKARNGFWFYSPDTDPVTGIKDMQTVMDSVAAGSTRFKLQLVSPLGFFSEVYGGHTNFVNLTSEAIDMVVYARILKERGLPFLSANSFNPLDTPDTATNGFNGVGISDGAGTGYIGYGKWRRRSPATGTFPNSGNGNALFDITGISQQQGAAQSVRGSGYFSISLNANIYEFGQAFTNTAHDFTDTDAQNFHEPLYIVNIIDTQADVENTNTTTYQEVGHYQKTEALIGITSGNSGDSFTLVDERIEDCIQTQPSQVRVLFLTDPNGNTTVWQDVTVFSAAQVAAINASIAAGTYQVNFNNTNFFVTGLYTHLSSAITSTYIEYRVIFNQAQIPVADSRVVVKYNFNEPIKTFGGDVTTHEAVFSPIDISWHSDGTPSSVSFNLPIPFPYIQYNMYKRPRIANAPMFPPFMFFRTETTSVGMTANFNFGQLGGSRLRQMLCMFTCQSRVNLPFEFEIEPAGQAAFTKYFPATHYIMRPFVWNNAAASPMSTNNDFDGQYESNYPKEAETFWGYGGFRFFPQVNIDYGKQDINHFSISKPKVGFVEQVEFCTRDIWSAIRPINVIDTSGVRTFPALNFFDISDDTGEIKYAYDDHVDDRGNNLYAITENGICVLLTEKTLLYDGTGNQIASIGTSVGVIKGQIWLDKTIGMNDEMWRSAAEGYHVNNGIRKGALFFGNHSSIYKLTGTQVIDILRGANFHHRVYPTLQQIGVGYIDNITGSYDTLNDEYWMQVQLVDDPLQRPPTFKASQVFVWEEKVQGFVGHYTYGFDKYISFKNRHYGSRRAKTYELGKGLVINGAPITSFLTGASAKGAESEYYYIRVDSDNQPEFIKFFNDRVQYEAGQVQALIDTNTNPLALKDYYSWANYIPRKNIAPFQRMEGHVVIYKIEHNRSERFKIHQVVVEYKDLK